MINLIIFGDRLKGESNSCFMAGLNGCNKIAENHLGFKGGIPIYSYTVIFDDSTTVEINNPIYATDSA